MYVCGSSSDVTLLAGIIVLEEFCKELAAIAFIKHYANTTWRPLIARDFIGSFSLFIMGDVLLVTIVHKYVIRFLSRLLPGRICLLLKTESQGVLLKTYQRQTGRGC